MAARLSVRTTLALAACLLLLPAAPARAQKSLEDYVQPSLRDLSASISVLSKNDRELGKIGKGYVDAYRLAKQEIWAKEPGRVAFQGKRGILTFRTVTNGARKLTEVASLRIRKVDDISKNPSKGDTLADLGVITSPWAGRVQSEWLRAETRNGRQLQVFQFWYREDPRYRHTVWMDPSTRTMVEHIAHHRRADRPGFKKKLVYNEIQQVGGVYLPTRVELYNGEGKLAAVMRYESIKVNTGLQDSLFTF